MLGHMWGLLAMFDNLSYSTMILGVQTIRNLLHLNFPDNWILIEAWKKKRLEATVDQKEVALQTNQEMWTFDLKQSTKLYFIL